MSYNTFVGYNVFSTATSPPAGIVTIIDIAPGSTTAQVQFSYDASDQTSFDYRLDSGVPNNSGPSTVITIQGLDPETQYEVEVRATNSAGEGTWSNSQLFTTLSLDGFKRGKFGFFFESRDIQNF